MSVLRPILYEKDTAEFTNNGLGMLSDGTDGRCTEQLNGGYEIKFNYPISGVNAENIAINRIVLAKPNRYDDPEPFRIYNITRSSSNYITVNAEHKSYELSGYPCLPNDNYIENAGSASTLMQYLTSECARTAAALGLPAYTFTTDITTTAKWTIENITDIKSAMALAAQYFGGEWKYTGTTCTLKAARGQDRGVKVQYGSNMQSISQTEIDTSFSHIMPYWTDGTDTVYVDGNYVAATAQAEPLRKHVLVVNLTTECDATYAGTGGVATKPTPAQLLTVAQNWLAENPPTPKEKNQRVKFVPRGQTVEYAYLGDIDHVELGDTISTENNPLNISTTQRCITLIYDFYRDIYIDAELGVPKANLSTAIVKEATKRETVVWVSVAEPTQDFQSGDYWIKIDGEVTRKAQALGRYTGGKWLLLCEFPEGGDGTGGNHIFAPNEPGATPEGSDGDYWVAFTGDTATHAYKMVNSQWQERSFTVGSQTPQTANVGDLFIVGSKEHINAIVEYRSFDYDPETGTFDFEGDTYRGWLQFYPSETFRQSGDTHDCFTTDGGVINDGDIWFQTASAANNVVTKIHERVSGAWVEQGAFSGVGLNAGKHNEIFNDYAGNTINSSGSTEDYNHVEGQGNTADGCYYSHITGKNNAAYHASGSYVGGQGNTVGQTKNASYHFIHGSNNVSDGGANNTILGQGNTINGSQHSFIAGGYNSANSGYHYILGEDNISGGVNYNVLLGYHNKSQYHSAFMIGIGGETTDNNQFVFSSGRTVGNTFVIDKDGNVSATSYTTPGADYAELFEWADGNPGNEDRRGMLVTLDGDKLVPANGDDILGAVSSRPSVVGNSADEYWRGKYKTDVFGEVIRDENGEPVLSEDYDESIAYTPRSKRREWSPVGMVGRLIVCDNGKCVPNGYVTARKGIASPTLSVTNCRVLRRVDERHIEILIK